MIGTVAAALKEKLTEALAILKINNKKVKVKLNTDAEVNVMPIRVFNQIEDGHVKMERTRTKLCGYGGTNIPVEGKIKVICKFRDAKQKSEFYVAKTDSKTVLSLQTCKELGMIQILIKVTSKEDNKKEKDGASMERTDIEKKVEMIAGKSGKELKQTTMKMYPNLSKGLEKIFHQKCIHLERYLPVYGRRSRKNWITWKRLV